MNKSVLLLFVPRLIFFFASPNDAGWKLLWAKNEHKIQIETLKKNSCPTLQPPTNHTHHQPVYPFPSRL